MSFFFFVLVFVFVVVAVSAWGRHRETTWRAEVVERAKERKEGVGEQGTGQTKELVRASGIGLFWFLFSSSCSCERPFMSGHEQAPSQSAIT